MRWKPLVTVVLIAFGGLVALWSMWGFDDTVPLALPAAMEAEAGPMTVEFHCAAPLRGASVEPSEEASNAEYPLARPACESPREQRRLLLALDLAVVVAGLLVVVLIRDKSSPVNGRTPDATNV